jgi:hypothetical protein
MLERAGLVTIALAGGHRREPFTATSDKLFIRARKPAGKELS